MHIDLAAADTQARHARRQAEHLREARVALLSYQRNLQSHWKGEEMLHIDYAVDDLLRMLAATADDLDSISSDIVKVAESVRGNEE